MELRWDCTKRTDRVPGGWAEGCRDEGEGRGVMDEGLRERQVRDEGVESDPC